MEEHHRSLLLRSSRHYCTTAGLELHYGVRGVVGDDAAALVSAVYKIGVVAALRSVKAKKVTGVVISACGVRIVDPDGGAVIGVWESLADSTVNVADPEEFVTLIEEFAKNENITFDDGQPAEVLLGRDTRPNGESLVEAAKEGINSVAGAIFHDMGLLTTPQLHWLVRSRNMGMKASEHDYFQQLSSSYRCLVDCNPEDATGDKIGESLVVDGAHGVGGDKIEALKDLCDGLEIEIRNTSKSGAILNQGAGVDFIREQKIVPSGFGSSDIGFRCASLDGDADRLVYFNVLPRQKEIEIVDGDIVLLLFTLYINEQLSILEEVENERDEGHYHARLGILLSADENGASTSYIRSLGLDVVSLPSRIRSLLVEASKYDIGIYFEADGHGGILFSDSYLSWLEDKNIVLLSSSKGSRMQLSITRLLAVSRLMSSTMSDALANLLLVEAILQHNGWSFHKWKNIYSDLINTQLNTVEVEEKMIRATETTELVGDSTTKDFETLIDEERSEIDKDGSHIISLESKHLDTSPTGPAVQQVVDCEAYSVEQTDIDASAESEKSQEEGTSTYVKAHETEAHAELLEVQNIHPSPIVSPHSDENADGNKLEASTEEEELRGSCINSERVVSLESDSCSDELLEDAEDPDHVTDKEKNETKRVESDDDAWVLVSDERGVTLNAGPAITETRDIKHFPKLDDEPCNGKESCSSHKVNGVSAPIENEDALLVSADTEKDEETGIISGNVSCDAELQINSGDTENSQPSSSPKIKGMHSPIKNMEDLLVSADTDETEEVKAISGTDSACDAQPQPQLSSVDIDEPQPSIAKESYSSPKVNGTLAAPGENAEDSLVSVVTVKAEEAETVSETESSCDAQLQPQISSVDIDEPQPSIAKESYSCPKVNGTLAAPGENAEDSIVSVVTVKAEEAEAVTETESSCDAQLQPQMSSSEADSPQLSNEKEICSSPKVNGILDPAENGDDLLVSDDTDEAKEAISGIESACDARPHLQMISGETDKPQLSNDKENSLIPKVNGILNPVEIGDSLLVSAAADKAERSVGISATESACDSQPDTHTSSDRIDEPQPSNKKERCLSPKVNGALDPTKSVDGLAVSADTEKIEGVFSGTASCSDAQSHPQTHIGDRFPSVVHDEKLEAVAQNGSVDGENGSNCLINGSSLNNATVSDELGDPSPLSDVGEEIGDPNVVGCTSLTIAPQVNGVVVTLPPFEHAAAKVEAEAEKNQVEVVNGSNYLVNDNSDALISFPSSEGNVESPIEISCSEVNVEALIETLETMPIPSDMGENEEAGATNDVTGITPPSGGGAGVENGIDVKPDDVVQAKRSVTDSSGTSKHESEVNNDISGCKSVQMAEAEDKSETDVAEVENEPEDKPENDLAAEIQETENTTVLYGSAEVYGVKIGEPGIKSENDPAEAERKSESVADSVADECNPCVNQSAETEVTNECESVVDILQSSSQISGSSTALDASSYPREFETQAETLDAQETENIIVSDNATPEFQVNNHDAEHLESKAENAHIKGAKSKDSYAHGVSVNSNIRFGSFEFVGSTCPKLEAQSTGSTDVDHSNFSSSNLGKAKGDIRVEETFDEINSQQTVAEDHAMSTVSNTMGDTNDGHALKGLVPTVGTSIDEESTSSLEGSAASPTGGIDGESIIDEPVKKPFHYLIRTPKYDDEKLSEQIRSAEIQLEEKTRIRDDVLTEYRKKKDSYKQLKADQHATLLEERTSARDLVRAKWKEIESAQLLVNIAKDAMTMGDLDNKIAYMEHTIQHETVSLNEEKKLIREIKQSKQVREQLLATTKVQGVQQALDQKNENEDRVKALRKEMDALRRSLSDADRAYEAYAKNLDSENEKLNELHKRLTSSSNDRQEAYLNLKELKRNWSDKNKQFWSYKDAQRQANNYAASGNRASLQSLCVNQVESTMKLWNQDNDFRRDYKRYNLRSSLRRLGTPDGRSLGPDEEPPSLAMAPVRRINASIKNRQVIRAAGAQPESVVESRKADTKSVNKVVQQLKPNETTKNPIKASPVKIEEAQASKIEKEKEDLEILKAKKEEEELARKAEELAKKEEELAKKVEEAARKENEAARLKELRRLEKAKFQEALERKRKQAEKAQARAELKARKEAEEKEKEKERRAKKKENKRGTADDATSNPDSEAATIPEGPSEPTKEVEAREKTITVMKRAQKAQYTKQTKLKTMVPPPPPLRNRGKRRMRQWMWVAVTIMAILGLFFLGNLNLREITGAFSSWH